MNFKLIPICSEEEHILKYEYKQGYKCELCHKKYISYRCINCEYGRCSGCHRDILGSEEISERLRKEKIENDIKLAELQLKEDGLTQWDVMVSNGEICYINKLMRTYSFDYPYTPPPNDSPTPNDSPIYSDIPIIKGEKIETNHTRCGITNVYDYLKNLIF